MFAHRQAALASHRATARGRRRARRRLADPRTLRGYSQDTPERANRSAARGRSALQSSLRDSTPSRNVEHRRRWSGLKTKADAPARDVIERRVRIQVARKRDQRTTRTARPHHRDRRRRDHGLHRAVASLHGVAEQQPLAEVFASGKDDSRTCAGVVSSNGGAGASAGGGFSGRQSVATADRKAADGALGNVPSGTGFSGRVVGPNADSPHPDERVVGSRRARRSRAIG